MNIINFEARTFFFILVFTVLAILLVGISMLSNKARNECESKGGQYVVSHYYITMVYSGKVMIPVNNPVYKCKLK